MRRRYIVQNQPGSEAHAFQTIVPALQCAAVRSYESSQPFFICEADGLDQQIAHRIVDVRRLHHSDPYPAKCKVLPP